LWGAVLEANEENWMKKGTEKSKLTLDVDSLRKGGRRGLSSFALTGKWDEKQRDWGVGEGKTRNLRKKETWC